MDLFIVTKEEADYSEMPVAVDNINCCHIQEEDNFSSLLKT
jgi:hypothetical protein